MKILSGIDLIYLPRFKKSFTNGGESFLKRLFHQNEIGNQKVEHLAGIFAAKEAVIKTLDLPVGSWHDIQISYKADGAPKVEIRNLKLEFRSSSISISHDGDYAIAQFVCILK